VKKSREQKLISHGEADKLLRKAQRELAQHAAHQRRVAEVDGEKSVGDLDVALLAVENNAGFWKFESLANIYPGQSKQLVAVDRDERLAICELRFALRNQMVEDRYCSEEAARKAAATAKFWVSGRVAYNRIVSR
jgi:hypothetical protein